MFLIECLKLIYEKGLVNGVRLDEQSEEEVASLQDQTTDGIGFEYGLINLSFECVVLHVEGNQLNYDVMNPQIPNHRLIEFIYPLRHDGHLHVLINVQV